MDIQMSEFTHFLFKEARDQNLDYTEKKVKGEIDRVTVELKGNKSGNFTKLIKEYSLLKGKIEDLETKQKELNIKIKAETEELFDSEDVVYTRCIDTVSATLSLSKKTVVTSTKTDYQKVIDAITDLVPSLAEQIQELIDANTKISTTEKSPALRVDLKEGVWDWLTGVWSKIKSWAKGYDKKLDNIKDMIEEL